MADNKYVNNMSYTNKDFASIFRELLQIVPQVTSKWNPQNSNEADPGVVLLKLMAVIADKLNYNVDKNILETFPQSVTQMASARQLYSALGYSMKWYMSATTKISMKYNIGSNTELPKSVTVPKFTMVTNDDGTVVYTLLGEDFIKDTEFTNDNQIHSINAIEGVINSVDVNGSTTITLANLDSDFRIYLPNIYVAQNGIFITNQGQNNFDSWRRADNLQSESLNQTVYKFGITDDQSGCYLEFPQDIANVIGSGLNIYYITSHGVHGNVSANNLTRFYSDFTVQQDNSTVNLTDNFFINNPSASTNGEDVESIEDAYRNYRKTIGTFDTLVTCRDYQNALYSLQNILSNVVVSDRSNDINHSVPIVTFDGTTDKKVITQPLSKMTAFDLAVYALKPMSDAVNEETFNDTFTPISSDVFWQDEISNFKSVEHDYVDVSSALTYIFENFFTLQGKVLTNYKVNRTEASDIENNIRLALWKSLNASKMTFGEQPEYSDLVDIIKNADTRIRDVVLDEPRYVLRRLKPGDGGVVDIPANSSDTTDKELLARLVLNGSIQLYKFDERYTPDYGQLNPKLVENIQKISTEASITVPKGDFYTLRENEVIQAIAPSYITTVTYTAYTDYEYNGLPVESGVTHTLSVGEYLTISYMDSDKNKITKTYSQGTTFTANINLTKGNETGTIQVTGNLGASGTIEIKEKNTTNLTEGIYYCYWITNVLEKDTNGEFQYVLFQENDITRLLDVNEYFVYADKDRTSLVILGSGTQLTRSAVGSNPLNKLTVKTKLSSDDINNLGLSAFQDSDWYVWEMSKVSLQITENDIYSFGEGTSLEFPGGSATLKNGLTPRISVIKYKETTNGEEQTLPSVPNGYAVRSRLNLLASKTSPQKLLTRQKVTLQQVTPTGGEAPAPIPIQGNDSTPVYVQFSDSVYITGGNNIDVAVTDFEGKTGYTLACYYYTKQNLSSPFNVSDGDIDVYCEDMVGQTNAKTIPFPYSKSKSFLVAVLKSGSNSTITVGSSNENLTISSIVSNITVKNPGVYYFKATCKDTELSAGSSAGIKVYADITSADSIRVYRPIPYTGYGPQLGDETTGVAVLEKLQELDTKNLFNYTYKVPEEDLIEAENPISAAGFWDKNNPFNRCTIARLDTVNSSIVVAPSSKLK